MDSNDSLSHLHNDRQKLKELEETIYVLKELQTKTLQQVIVPINPVGFLEGTVSDTATVRVSLSNEIIVECGVEHAMGILDRRQTELRRSIERREQHISQLSSMCSSINEMPLQDCEVMEESVSRHEEQPQGSEIKSDDDILAMLNRMEKLELEAEAKSQELSKQSEDPRLITTKIPTRKQDVIEQKRVERFMGFSGDVKEHDVSFQTQHPKTSIEETEKPEPKPEVKQQKMSLFKKRLLSKDQ